ncbi:MAG TPA: hypothetical protein VHA10_08960, partial [Hypericibacter adhaerens]
DAAAEDFDIADRLQSGRLQRPNLRASTLIGRAYVSRAKGEPARAAADIEAAKAIDPEAETNLIRRGLA